jgi:hypothetical protein
MKSISLVIGFGLVLFGIHANVYSQDIITLKTGDEIKAVVSEIDNEIIKYKKFENPTGPFYNLDKGDVFMIKYENGTKEIFNTEPVVQVKTGRGAATTPAGKGGLAYRKPAAILQNNMVMSKDESRAVLSKNSEALKSYNKGLKLIKTGSVLAGVSLITSFGVTLLIKNPSLTTSIVAIAISSGTLTGSIVTTVTGRKKIKKAVNLFNASIDK